MVSAGPAAIFEVGCFFFKNQYNKHICNMQFLYKSNRSTNSPIDREHSPYTGRNPFEHSSEK